MIDKLIIHAPTNSLSLGNVSYNILRELFKRKIQCAIFPRQVDLGAYNVPLDFKNWLEFSINNRFTKYNKNIPELAIWHISNSEAKHGNRQYLFTFHETSSPTNEEINIVNQQEHTFFSSNWSVDNFKTYGANNVSFVPLGFDEDFSIINGAGNDKIIHWGLIGSKFEGRKNTELTIKTWIKKYGSNPKHMLSLAVTNPFFNKQAHGFDTNDILNQIFAGNKPFNVNILPYLKTNIEMNQTYNSLDIDLTGLSSSEGFNLPAFNCTALGKWSAVTNFSAHKDWATDKNSILIEPKSMRPVYDGKFFVEGQPFNQGSISQITENQIIEAMEKVEPLAKTINIEGLKLQKEFTYSKTVDKILEKII